MHDGGREKMEGGGGESGEGDSENEGKTATACWDDDGRDEAEDRTGQEAAKGGGVACWHGSLV